MKYMNCRHCGCPVSKSQRGPITTAQSPEEWFHACITTFCHWHNHLPEPDKRINTQPINTEEN